MPFAVEHIDWRFGGAWVDVEGVCVCVCVCSICSAAPISMWHTSKAVNYK